MKDKPIRSVVKGISWRVFASIDTFLLSWLIFGDYVYAGGIALMEVLTKVILFYFHERGWNIVKWGRGKDGKINHLRSVAKSISWRLIGSIDSILISWIITGVLSGAFILGGSELVTKILLFYIHERVWVKIKWGRKFQ